MRYRHRTIRYRLAAVALGAATVAVASGCSSSSQGAASSASQSAVASSPQTGSSSPVGADAIRIGVIGSESGPQASSEDQFATVAPAWQQYVNQTLKGINGHDVSVYVVDDGANPAKAQAAVQTLVNQDKVSVIVAGSDDYVYEYEKYVTSHGIALLSGVNNSLSWYGTAGVYPLQTDADSEHSGRPIVAKKFGNATNYADVYCSEAPSCSQTLPQFQKEAQSLGMKFTSLAVSSTAPSYTAQCLALKQRGVDYVELNVAGTTAATIVQSCQQQGYNPTYGANYQVLNSTLQHVPNVTIYGTAPAFPYTAQSPAVDAFRKAMQSFAKSNNWMSGTGTATWSGLEMARLAITNAGSTVTAASVSDALKQVKDNNLNGLLANKVTLSGPTSLGSRPCFFVYEVKGGQIQVPQGLTPVCANALSLT